MGGNARTRPSPTATTREGDGMILDYFILGAARLRPTERPYAACGHSFVQRAVAEAGRWEDLGRCIGIIILPPWRHEQVFPAERVLHCQFEGRRQRPPRLQPVPVRLCIERRWATMILSR